MNPQTLRNFLATRPFEPFDVELSSGQTMSVRHPECVIVLPNTLVVAQPGTDMVQWTSLIHIVGVRRKQATLPDGPAAPPQIETPSS